mmetsp:Transcript_41957/g.98873  ORF Transcript_41957/g.98873 Transcript_41957/m.98873 type:complete len:484 (+) Transcript_41957:61-1512(+)
MAPPMQSNGASPSLRMRIQVAMGMALLLGVIGIVAISMSRATQPSFRLGAFASERLPQLKLIYETAVAADRARESNGTTINLDAPHAGNSTSAAASPPAGIPPSQDPAVPLATPSPSSSSTAQEHDQVKKVHDKAVAADRSKESHAAQVSKEEANNAELRAHALRIWNSPWMQAQPPHRKILFFSAGNSGFLPFWQSWLCNTKAMEGVHQQTLLVTSGDNACEKLQPNDFNVATHCIPSEGKLHDEALTYGTYGYWKITLHRLEMVHFLLQSGISLLIFEPDAVWVQNPLDDPDLLTQYDLRALRDGHAGIGFGWFLLRSNPQTVAIFHKVVANYGAEVAKSAHLGTHGKLQIPGEQDHFNMLLQKKKQHISFSNITFAWFSNLKYLGGIWYDGGRGGTGETQRAQCKKQGLPYVINNNWIVGNTPKIVRAKRWGHWFVQNDTDGSCHDDGKLKDQMKEMLLTMETLKPIHGPPLKGECPLCR